MNNENGDILSLVSHVSIYTFVWVQLCLELCGVSVTGTQKYSLVIGNEVCVTFLILH